MLTTTEVEMVTSFVERTPLREHDAGDVLVVQGDAAPHLGIVSEGLVKGILNPRHGPIRTAVLTVVGERHWLGLECLSDGHNIEYRCLTDCRVRLFDATSFLEEAPHAVVRALLKEASWLLNRTIHLHYTGRLGMDQRVLSRLCDLRESCSLPEVHITQEDLASLVGVHRNRIGESLRRLEARGLLECGYGEILLGDLTALEQAYAELG